MLMYFTRGIRRFERAPSDVTNRHNWEFFIITSGYVAPYYGDGIPSPPRVTRTLWLIPPQKRYSWYGRGANGNRIVFHFSSVDESIQLLLRDRDYLSIPLGKGDLSRIQRIADEVQPYYQSLSLLSPLYFTKAQVELSLLVAEKYVHCDQAVTSLNTKNQMLAQRAIAFFESQLPRRPLVEEVAATVNISTTQLRRIFLETFHEPPKHLFLLAQLEYAKNLAAGSDMLINEVAVRSGFNGAPDFCRAFRKYNHTTFHQWRMQVAAIKCSPQLRSKIPAPQSQSE